MLNRAALEVRAHLWVATQPWIPRSFAARLVSAQCIAPRTACFAAKRAAVCEAAERMERVLLRRQLPLAACVRMQPMVRECAFTGPPDIAITHCFVQTFGREVRSSPSVPSRAGYAAALPTRRPSPMYRGRSRTCLSCCGRCAVGACGHTVYFPPSLAHSTSFCKPSRARSLARSAHRITERGNERQCANRRS